MKFEVSAFRRLLCCSLLGAAALMAQAPAITAVQNAASQALTGAPNAAIAQGALFSVYGSNLGGTDTSLPNLAYPLPKTLRGTSLRVTVNGTSVDAIPLYAINRQVNALLPSTTPIGTGTITVTYNGQTSASAPITVAKSSFGTFTLNSSGSGPGIFTNYIAAGNEPVNTLTAAANPGQLVTIWGTGLGAVRTDDAAGAAPGDLRSTIGDVQVLVGGKPAQINYAGRSGCCAGLDQIQFVVPSGVQGCYVSVFIIVNNVVSNSATIAIANTGQTCSDPFGTPSSVLTQAQSSGTARIGTISLTRSVTTISAGGFSLDTTADSATADFYRYTFSDYIRQASNFGQISLGSCTIYTIRADDNISLPDVPQVATALDAGPALTLNGPGGSRQLTKQADGSYGVPLNTANTAQFLSPGTYTVTAPGGTGANAVGAFNTSITLPTNFTWTNRTAITNIQRSQGQNITWSGGDPNGYVQIYGFSTSTANKISSFFFCSERVAARSFTVPAAVLLALPASPTGGGLTDFGGFLGVGTGTPPVTFNATGLDYGSISAATVALKTVTYQ